MRQNLYPVHIAVLDTETTGAGHHDEMIELGIAIISGEMNDEGQINSLQISDTYSGLREPAVPISPGAQAVHGISPDMLVGQELDYLKVKSLLLGSHAIVAHNARFDQRFVFPLLPETKEKVWLCSLYGIPWKGMGFSSRALQSLLKGHSIKAGAAHRALDDAYALAQLLLQSSFDGQGYLELLLRGKRGSSVRELAFTRHPQPGL
jgi:DNA polymerase-3 subunit epsilon